MHKKRLKRVETDRDDCLEVKGAPIVRHSGIYCEEGWSCRQVDDVCSPVTL